MGLDISAYSRLRYIGPAPEDWESGDDDVIIYQVDGDRTDGHPYGIYTPIELVHVWWHAEHGTYAIPDEEVVRIATHIKALLEGTIKAGTPGDLAALDDSIKTSEYHGFRAGSYSGYNWWRKQLSVLAHDVEPEEIWDGELEDGAAFVELIDFPDNEGAIGPKTSAKLAADFAVHAEAIENKARETIEDAGELDYFLESYGEWKTAFELAMHDGFVVFH